MKNAEVIAESIKREYLEKLRDDFAAKAMIAYVSPDMLYPAQTDAMAQIILDNCANFSYRMADAMLKARDAD